MNREEELKKKFEEIRKERNKDIFMKFEKSQLRARLDELQRAKKEFIDMINKYLEIPNLELNGKYYMEELKSKLEGEKND